MLLDIVLLHLVACLTGEDNQLADNVRSTEVDTRIGLRVTLFLGAANGLREGHVGSNLVEDEIQRTREDCFNLQYLIA